MHVFGITPQMKRENRQYWGRELGMCWQLLLTSIFRFNRADFAPAMKSGKDEPCAFAFGTYAVDTKYRIGSGDSGTLKKFKSYGQEFRSKGYTPVMLILREDNLPAAITACVAGGWEVFIGKTAFSFIQDHAGFDLEAYLAEKGGDYRLQR
jgi:hypothetical protein